MFEWFWIVICFSLQVDHSSKFGFDNSPKNVPPSAIDNIASMEAAERIAMEGKANYVGSDRDVEMSDTVVDRSKAVARSALFGDEMEQAWITQMTKPVILQHSPASLTIKPRVIECIANSVLGSAPVTRDLGGMSMTSSTSSSCMDSSSILLNHSMSMTMPVSGPRTAKLVSYSLQGGYDRFATLPGLEGRTTDQHSVFVLQHVDTEFNLATSFLGGRVRGQVGTWGPRWGSLAEWGGPS